jgi:hypothetical protein
MKPSDFTDLELAEWRSFILSVIDPESSKMKKLPKGKRVPLHPEHDPVMVQFVKLFFSPTFEPDILGYQLPYELFCSFPKSPQMPRSLFAAKFRKVCQNSPHLGFVELARNSQMKGLRWVRFATDAEIRERRAVKD